MAQPLCPQPAFAQMPSFERREPKDEGAAIAERAQPANSAWRAATLYVHWFAETRIVPAADDRKRVSFPPIGANAGWSDVLVVSSCLLGYAHRHGRGLLFPSSGLRVLIRTGFLSQVQCLWEVVRRGPTEIARPPTHCAIRWTGAGCCKRPRGRLLVSAFCPRWPPRRNTTDLMM